MFTSVLYESIIWQWLHSSMYCPVFWTKSGSEMSCGYSCITGYQESCKTFVHWTIELNRVPFPKKCFSWWWTTECYFTIRIYTVYFRIYTVYLLISITVLPLRWIYKIRFIDKVHILVCKLIYIDFLERKLYISAGKAIRWQGTSRKKGKWRRKWY